MKSPAETRAILKKLEKQHPNADTELHFTTPYELLVATILSAQCTDERVNKVTPPLFKRYPNATALANATTAELEPQIQSTGFFRSKSKSLLGMATAARPPTSPSATRSACRASPSIVMCCGSPTGSASRAPRIRRSSRSSSVLR